MKAQLDGKPQTEAQFDANVAAIGGEMQVMIERTNELLASGEVTVEAVSA